MDLSFYSGKRVLVTGHTGFKGSWLCKILVEAGAVVIGYALEPPTKPNLFEISVNWTSKICPLLVMLEIKGILWKFLMNISQK